MMHYQNKGIIMQETKTIYFSELLHKWHPKIFNNLKSILKKHGYKVETLKNTKDIWIRDFMPIVFDNKCIQYRYYPDYLMRPSLTPYRTNPQDPINEITLHTEKTELILDGGNIVKYNNTAIMTDKFFQENIGIDSNIFQKLFPLKKFIVIPRDPDVEEIYGHADGMVRFISENHLLVNSQYPETFKRKLHARLKETGFKITELKMNKDTKYAWGYSHIKTNYKLK